MAGESSLSKNNFLCDEKLYIFDFSCDKKLYIVESFKDGVFYEIKTTFGNIENSAKSEIKITEEGKK